MSSFSSTTSSGGTRLGRSRSRENSGANGDTSIDGFKVDFIQRTIKEREKSGKRKIKPTHCTDILVAEDSDDPDFDLDEEDCGSDSEAKQDSSASDSDNKRGGSTTDSDDSSAESSDDDDPDESTSDSSDGSEDSDTPTQKPSILRNMMEQFNNHPPVFQPKKKKKKPKPNLMPIKEQDSIASTIGSVLASVKTGSVPGTSKVLTNGISATNKKNKKSSAAKNQKIVRNKKNDDIKKRAKKKVHFTHESKKQKKIKKKLKYGSLSQLIADTNSLMDNVRRKICSVDPICAICLSDKTVSSNEVVECDSCKITCHEDCYNTADDDCSGTASSSSTSPWFCDVCKSGRKDIYCELCPNTGGLFKETVSRTWVHSICALYTLKGFGYHKTSIDLTQIRASEYGAKHCVACDNDRLSRVGIPISCDAGLCRENLHVTCAQKLGLLSDPQKISNEADPLYVTCRAHLASDMRKKHSERYQILQEQIRRKKLRAIENQSRVEDKLGQARQRYGRQYPDEQTIRYDLQSREIISIPVEFEVGSDKSTIPVPTKRVRMMDTSAFAVLQNDRKVQFTHYDVDSILLQQRNDETVLKAKKSWYVNPALTVAFAAYYVDRQRRIEELTENVQKVTTINETLCNKESEVTCELENKAVEHMTLSDKALGLKTEDKFLRSMVTNFGKIGSPQTERKSKSPSRKNKSSAQSASKKTASNQINARFHAKKNKSSNSNKVVTATAPNNVFRALNRCSICQKHEKQHLIILCDKCKNHYHMGCLDPPLTRRPRITQTCGWMCADCDEKDKEEEDETPTVDVDAPRALRGRTSIKKPSKYQYDYDSDYDDPPPIKLEKLSLVVVPTQTKQYRPVSTITVSIKQERTSPVKPATEADPFTVDMIKQKPKPNKSSAISPALNGNKGAAKEKKPKLKIKRSKNPLDPNNLFISGGLSLNHSSSIAFTTGKCATCKGTDYVKNFVKCDKCTLDFHFLCLEPPLKYSPKRRGYNWFCTNCDETASLSSDMGSPRALLENGMEF